MTLPAASAATTADATGILMYHTKMLITILLNFFIIHGPYIGGLDIYPSLYVAYDN